MFISYVQRLKLELESCFDFCFVLAVNQSYGHKRYPTQVSTEVSTAPKTQISGEVSYIFVTRVIKMPTLMD